MALWRQYAAKLASNVAAAVAGVAVLAVVPRALGPAAYGRYEFLSNFFVQVTAFLDTGTSSCFYTRLSQRPGARGLLAFYALFVGGLAAILLAGVAAAFFSPLAGEVWAGESFVLVLLAALLGCLTWWVQIARKAVDAHHQTVLGETLFMLNRLGMAAALLAVVWCCGLDVQGYFLFQIVVSAVALALLSSLLARRWPPPPPGAEPSFGAHARDFWHYSSPLLTYAVVGALTGLVERWLLQTRAGAEQQGYFGLAYQVGAVCFLFTGALTQLLTREFARSWAESDLERMGALFSRHVPMLYAVAAYLAVFVALRAEDVARLVGGAGYAAGAGAVALMALYPMHQTYGQLSGSVFLATGRTRPYRNIGVAGMLVGLPLAWWLTVPAADGGLGLGSVGLAVKAVLLQAVLVNVQLWHNARLLSLRFGHFLVHQTAVPIVFALCAWAATAAVGALGLGRVPDLLLSGIAYTLLVAVAAYWQPGIFSLRRDEIGQWLAAIRLRLGRGEAAR